MEYSQFKNDIQISKLGFGAMRFATTEGKPDQQIANEIISRAYNAGVNYFDTAYVYQNGLNEGVLATALSQFDRKTYYLADKMPLWLVKDENDLAQIFNTTLQRLNTDYVDFYLMHAMDFNKLDMLKQHNVIEFAKQLKAQGKIKYLGFSIHAPFECMVELLNLYDWDFVQIQYNYLDEFDNPGKKGYDELVKRNIPVIIMEPLKGGLLSNLPDILTDEYKKLNKSNTNLAFRWLLSQDNIVTILSGMNQDDQVKENLEIFDKCQKLNEKEYQAIEIVKHKIFERQQVKCTGCRYCMPCPFGVNIPEIFKAWNTASLGAKTDNWIRGMQIDYDNARKCVGCNHCTQHCPQLINIPEKIQQLLKLESK